MFSKNNKFYLVAVLISALALTACHPRVDPASDMDQKLSCAQLQQEIQSTKATKQKIQKSRGLSMRNVGLAIFFWPGVFINEITGDEAATEANNKLLALQNIYAKKQCTADDCGSLAQSTPEATNKG